MFVLESVIGGGEATEKKFDTDAAAFVAMKESFMDVTGKSELEIAEILSGEVSPDCEFTVDDAAAYASRSYWNICPEDLIEDFAV